MVKGQRDKRHAMAHPIDELTLPALVRRAEGCGWQLRRWAAVGEDACSSLTVAL